MCAPISARAREEPFRPRLPRARPARRGAGDGRAGVGAAEAAGLRRIHQCGASDHARQREAAGERFRDRDKIGLDPGMLDREKLAGAGEAGLDLIGDEDDPVFVGITRAARQNSGAPWDRMKPTLALNRLDDNGGDPIGLDIRAEEEL